MITKYDAAQTPLASIHFTAGIENGNGFPSWIEDMTFGGSETLWLAGYNGEIYHVDSTGAVISNFNSGHLYNGVATDGSFLYTTGGFDNGNIYKRAFDGTLLATISTGAPGLGGLGFDALDGTFCGGYYDNVYHIDSAGNILGDSFVAVGAFHDGLEAGDIGEISTPVPEPGTVLLLTSALGMLCLTRKCGRRSI